MKNINILFVFLSIVFFSSSSLAQISKISGKLGKTKAAYIANVKKQTVRDNRATKTNYSPGKIMTSQKHIWVMPQNGKKGYWASAKPNELKARQNQIATYAYDVSFSHLKGYGQSPGSHRSPKPPFKKLDVKKVTENKNGLKDALVKSTSIGDKNSTKTSVYYFRKIELNAFLCAQKNDIIIVTDTLFVPVAQKGKSNLTSLWYQDRNYIKVIADCIVYESPVNLISSSRESTDFVFAANDFIFKSPYNKLSAQNLMPAPPFYFSAERNTKGYKDPMTENERILLNRLYVYTMDQMLTDLENKNLSSHAQEKLLNEYNHILMKKFNKSLIAKDWKTQVVFERLANKKIMAMNYQHVNGMEEIITSLNANNNLWANDNLLASFETTRRVKINRSLLQNDQQLVTRFNNVCNEFDAKYGQKELVELRRVGQSDVLVVGEITDLANTPFDYYTLPGQARLLPVSNQHTGAPTALGFIIYNATGDAAFELNLDVELSYNSKTNQYVSNTLSKSGIELQKRFPGELVSIEEQVLKINGQNVGRIIPIGNQNIRLEINLPDDGLSLMKLFAHAIEFKVEYMIQGQMVPLSQTLSLDINPSLIKQLDAQNIMNSFSVLENTSMLDVIKLSSQIDALRENEGILNRVEVMLEFNFENQTVFRGPFRLSSAGTLASGQAIQFLKYSEDFSVKVSGEAFYEDGKRDIMTFETKEQIIVIDENKLK